MISNRQLLKRFVKFGSPAIVVFFFVVPLYGFVNPWLPAASILQSYLGQTAVLVGIGYSYKASYTLSGSTEREITSHSYVLVPSVFTLPKTITIVRINNEPLTVSESRYGFLFSLIGLIGGLFGTWWFWFRRSATSAQGVS